MSIIFCYPQHIEVKDLPLRLLMTTGSSGTFVHAVLVEGMSSEQELSCRSWSPCTGETPFLGSISVKYAKRYLRL